MNLFESIPTFTSNYFLAVSDLLFGYPEYRDTTRERFQIKYRTYSALVNLWNEVNKLVEKYGAGHVPLGRNTELSNELDAFKETMMEIYDDFEVGVKYDKGGLLEGWNETIGKSINKFLVNNSDITRDLMEEFNQFWDSFTALVKTEDKKRKDNGSLDFSIGEITSDTIADNGRMLLENIESAKTDQNASLDQKMQLEFLALLEKPVGTSLTAGNKSKVALATAQSLTGKMLDITLTEMVRAFQYDDYKAFSPGQEAINRLFITREFYKTAYLDQHIITALAKAYKDLDPQGKHWNELVEYARKKLEDSAKPETKSKLLGLAKDDPESFKQLTGVPVWALVDEIEAGILLEKIILDWEISIRTLDAYLIEVGQKTPGEILKKSIVKMGQILTFGIAAKLEPGLRFNLFHSIYKNLELLLSRESVQMFSNISKRIEFELWWGIKTSFYSNMWHQVNDKLRLISGGIEGMAKDFQSFVIVTAAKVDQTFMGIFEEFMTGKTDANVMPLESMKLENLRANADLASFFGTVKEQLLAAIEEKMDTGKEEARPLNTQLAEDLPFAVFLNCLRELGERNLEQPEKDFRDQISGMLDAKKIKYEQGNDFFVNIMVQAVKEEVAKNSYLRQTTTVGPDIVLKTAELLGSDDIFKIERGEIMDRFVRAENLLQNTLVYNNYLQGGFGTDTDDALYKVIKTISPKIEIALKTALSEELYNSFPEIAELLNKDLHTTFDLKTPDGVIGSFARDIKHLVTNLSEEN